MHKLLILAGAEVHVKVVRAAQRLGIYTIVTDYLPRALSPAKCIADEAWDIDIMDTESIIARARAAGVTGVLNYAIDPAQIPYERIARALALPCYGTAEQFAILTDKRRFREAAAAHGLDVVPEYTVDELAADASLFPVIVKPTSSRGSRGQTICYSYGELVAAVPEEARGSVIIERYLVDAWDFSLAALVADGRVHIVKLGDRYLGRACDGLERQQIATVVPSVFSEWFRAAILPQVEEFTRALGLEFAPLFLQGLIAGGRVYFYDPGLRLPGTDYDLVLQATTGCDAVRSLVEFAVTGRSRLYGDYACAYRYGGELCLIYSIAGRAGRVGTIRGLEALAADPRVLAVDVRCRVGDEIPASGDIRQRMFELTVRVPDMRAAQEFTELVNDTLVVLDDAGRDMLVSRLGRDVALLLEGEEDCLAKYTQR